MIGESPTTALLTGLTVLIVSRPCALGLATPLAIASGVGTAARRGIIVAAETIFENASGVDIIALDKTGSLTTGTMSVVAVEPANELSIEDVLRRAASLERFSEHPVASTIVEEASNVEGKKGDTDTTVDEFERHRLGVSGRVDGEETLVGHPALFDEYEWSLPATLEKNVEQAYADGDVPALVGSNGHVQGVITVGDAPRPEWKAAVETLSQGREIVVITGDEGAAADRFRDAEGVGEVFVGVPSEAKAETIRRLRSRGTVAMVGDRNNDSPALAVADIGIAMGGTQLATDAADAVIISDDLEAVAETFAIAAKTHRHIRQNLGWAFC